MSKILVTGGAGYIGSHTVLELLARDYEVVIFDNFCNSSRQVIPRLQALSGKPIDVIEGNLLDAALLADCFQQQQISEVIHFAGLKAVGESVNDPLSYYRDNVQGSLVLFDEMAKAGVKRIVFSSSASVYGQPKTVPIREDCSTAPASPYGRTKLMIEDILRDLVRADQQWRVSLLRYFNPVGAHSSGRIGEDPRGEPNNLLPAMVRAAAGQIPHLSVYGDDYATADGTGVRDYIHVVDLARAHLMALEKLDAYEPCSTYNLGTGTGYSVLQLIQTFARVCGVDVPYKIMPRRDGDVAECYADPALSAERLGWQTELGLEQMLADHWNWQQSNPQGFEQIA